MKKKLLVISNDRIYFNKKKISSDYNDTINIIEALNKKYELSILCREANNLQNFFVKNFYPHKTSKVNIFRIKQFLQIKIFMISITPYNFLNFLLIFILNQNIKGFVYLRSDGHKEYFYKYGYIGEIFYDLIFKFITSKLKVLSVSKNITGSANSLTISPSELNAPWFVKRKKPIIDKFRLLYIGRIKKEKGIFSFLKILNQIDIKFSFTAIGAKKKYISKNKKIRILKETSDQKKIINYYDNANIFILPSFTEGFPKVILECLSRNRPIIVFEEIKHVAKSFNGVFVCKRNKESFKETLNYIFSNYLEILQQIKKNKLPTKKNFQKKLIKLI